MDVIHGWNYMPELSCRQDRGRLHFPTGRPTQPPRPWQVTSALQRQFFIGNDSFEEETYFSILWQRVQISLKDWEANAQRKGRRFVIKGKILTLQDDTNVLGAFIFKHINTKLQQALSYLKYWNRTNFDEVAFQPVTGRQCGKLTTKEGRG